MIIPTPENAPPGTEVVCIDGSPCRVSGDAFPLKLGAIYTVSGWLKAGEMAFGRKARFLSFFIYEYQSTKWCFDNTRFRLLHRAASPDFYATQRELEHDQ